MNKSRTLLSALLLLFVLAGLTAAAQNTTNTAALQKAAGDLAARHTTLQRILNQKAKENGWPLIMKSKKGRLAFLHGIDAFGLPIYVTTTDNIISAATIRTTSL